MNRYCQNVIIIGMLSAVHGLGLGPVAASAADDAAKALSVWDSIERMEFKGGLRAFWNVGGKHKKRHEAQALAHGFNSVSILNTYKDYPGHQKEKIVPAGHNPWNKPPFFERIIRRNIEQKQAADIYVHDIEFEFEEDLDKLWADPELRKRSGADSRAEFKKAYYRAWGSWYAQPCIWTKQVYPRTPVGIYGPQPFRRDYWGITGHNAQQIDGTHKTDAYLWKYIHPYVDFVIASIYCFYDRPGSIYYMGANVEENCEAVRQFGRKPVCAYLWLRYHNSNKHIGRQPLDDYMVEAMAVVPYFCGARGTVLWGDYRWGLDADALAKLPLFAANLKRVADLSERIAKAQPVDNEPVHVLWNAKRPLIRKLRVNDSEWLVMACNPWQKENATSTVNVKCGPRMFDLNMNGRHTEIYHIKGNVVTGE